MNMTIILPVPNWDTEKRSFPSCEDFCPFNKKINQCCHSKGYNFESTEVNCYYNKEDAKWGMKEGKDMIVVVFI